MTLVLMNSSVCLLGVLLCLMPLTVRAQDKPDFVIDMPVMMDDRSVGTLAVGVTGSEVLFVDAASWGAFAPGKIERTTAGRVLEQAVDGRISLRAFSEAGLNIAFDHKKLHLTLTPRDEQREIQTISLRRGDPPGKGERDTVGVAAYVNARASQQFVVENTAGDTGRQAFLLGINGAARLFGADGVALEGSIFYDELAEETWRRGEVRLFHDDVENAIRYTAGDLFYLSSAFQGVPPLVGLSAERSYGTLQPFRIVSATGQQSFVIRETARVETYVNGTFQNVVRLRPGRYNLRDFAFTEGLNDVRLVVEDDAGERRIIDFTLFLDINLLEQGLSEFSVNAGFRRDLLFDEIRYDFEEPAWSGFYRYGVTNYLTLGVNYQGSPDLHAAGLEAIAGSPLGIVSGAATMSTSEEHGGGFAAAVDWLYNFGFFGERRDQEITLSGIYLSRNFLPLGFETPNNPFEWQLLTRFTTPLLERTYAGITGRLAFARDGDDPFIGDETSVGFTISRSFDGFSLSANASYTEGRREEEIAGFVTLSVPLSPSEAITAAWESQFNRTRIDYNRFSRDVVGDISGHVGLVGAEDDFSADADIAYRGNRFIARAIHDFQPEGFFGTEAFDTRFQATTLQLETGVAFAGDTVAMGRPITDAFALVKRHETLSDTTIGVNSVLDEPVAVADDFGPAVVPNLSSYRTQVVGWDAEDVPVGYALGDTARTIIPSARSGFVFQAGSAASITALGVALAAGGQPISLASGTVRPADGRDFPAKRTFTNRAGRFVVQGLEPGEYIAEFADDTEGMFRFTVEEGAIGVVDVGRLEAWEKM
ncbi:MAG: hypothetical protein ACLFWF_06170 [Alphaproteobacteria bacterium]